MAKRRHGKVWTVRLDKDRRLSCRYKYSGKTRSLQVRVGGEWMFL